MLPILEQPESSEKAAYLLTVERLSEWNAREFEHKACSIPLFDKNFQKQTLCRTPALGGVRAVVDTVWGAWHDVIRRRGQGATLDEVP